MLSLKRTCDFTKAAAYGRLAEVRKMLEETPKILNEIDEVPVWSASFVFRLSHHGSTAPVHFSVRALEGNLML